MRKIRTILLAVLLGCTLAAQAQPAGEVFGVVKADAVTLVDFLRKEISPDIFFVPDSADHRTYTIRVPREQFLERAFAEMRGNGYTVTAYDGKYFILHGMDLGMKTLRRWKG